MKIEIDEPYKIILNFNREVNVFCANSGEGKTFIAKTLINYSRLGMYNVGVVGYNTVTDEEVISTVNRIEKSDNPLLIIDNCDLLLRRGISGNVLLDNKCIKVIFIKELNKLNLIRKKDVGVYILYMEDDALKSEEILSW